MNASPKLLVSVRNACEAKAAIDGGCDILDVKEPENGPLGRAGDDEWQAISDLFARDECPGVPLSLALGELHQIMSLEAMTHQPLPIPANVSFVKAGLSQASEAWEKELEQLKVSIAHSGQQSAPKQVMVAYADFERVAAPPIDEVLQAAISLQSPVLLIDTFVKDSENLLTWMSGRELQRIADRCQQHGIRLALAGSLRVDDLNELADIPFDIIAVRTAVCEREDRLAEVTKVAVANFRRQLHIVWNARRRSVSESGEAVSHADSTIQ